MSDSVRPHRWQPTRLHRPWDSPGKNTGVDCHFLLQCMKVKSESEVTQLRPSLHDPMDCSLPGSSVQGILILKSGCVRNSTLLFYKMALSICGPMRFYLKFRMNFSTSVKNTIGSLIGIELNL